MKEEEAKTKWCPMVRSTGAELNREKPASDCIASDCMMWQQTDNECDPQPDLKDSSAVVPEPKCYPAGHCGLAGK